MLITFPNVWAVNERRSRNHIQQIAESRLQDEGSLIPFALGKVQGFLFRSEQSHEETLVIPKARPVGHNHARVIEATISNTHGSVDLRNAVWLKHPLLKDAEFDSAREIQSVLDSWKGAFSYIEEDPMQGIVGLRPPQIGAIHAIHAHWSVSDAAATIVMPTGTGKTETMLSILVTVGCPRLLVVVPTDALRTQIAEKFSTLGILKEPDCKILAESAKYPIVGILQHIPRTVAEVDDIFGRCNVIVTTSSIAGQCESAIQNRMAAHCPYLFIDEAHHAEAPTWSVFRRKFAKYRVVQFTATPFREDGKPIDGDIVFKYPLKKAQKEGYFAPIRFRPVVEFNPKKSDAKIAAKAIEQLRADAKKGHIIMARVDSVARAKDVFEIYRQHPEFVPVQLHTGIKSVRERDEARAQILSGKSRIVVCVDMLGEGFDLPELKIAAFHDIRKSLAVTLQLAGRFTRARPDLGEATFIANTADVQVQDELRKLYARDPDWNALLPELSDTMIGEQVSLQEFLGGFTNFAREIPLKTVRPATSMVVYRTRCANWSPENFRAGIPAIESCEQVHETTNETEHTLIVVTARRLPLDWTDAEMLFRLDWELYVAIWSPEQNLLFINSSTNAGEYRRLAEAVAGSDVVLVRGQEVFRTFAWVNRLRLQNVGLTEQLGRNVRYTGRMGADVEAGVPALQRQRARKSVLSGSGYEEGHRVTVGASQKGRIWAQRRDRVDQLAAWCKRMGTKLLNTAIDPDDVLKGTLDAKTVVQRPAKMPIAIDWPEEMYRSPEAAWLITIDGQDRTLSELNIELANPEVEGALRFAMTSEAERAELELQLFEANEIPNYRFIVRGDKAVYLRRGSSQQRITDFFYDNPPIIWFVDGSSLDGNQYMELKTAHAPYNPEKIQTWNWAGVDLKKESQGRAQEADSIQARVIRELKKHDYTIIVDDDGSGEAADVVAIRLTGDSATPTSVDVEFYHCKFSQESTPGHRIKDLYEVCGQAQKSVSWALTLEKRVDLFTHLLRREAMRQDSGGPSRLQLGDTELLDTIREMSRLCPTSLKIFIVQPGVSKATVSREQLQLMSVTENYLFETYQLPFGVIASP